MPKPAKKDPAAQHARFVAAAEKAGATDGTKLKAAIKAIAKPAKPK